MTHPGEQFYPEGVRWDDPIARGTLPDLLSQAARDYSARTVIEFRDRAISYAELEGLVEAAAAAYLRAGYGKGTSVALFLGNNAARLLVTKTRAFESLSLWVSAISPSSGDRCTIRAPAFSAPKKLIGWSGVLPRNSATDVPLP